VQLDTHLLATHSYGAIVISFDIGSTRHQVDKLRASFNIDKPIQLSEQRISKLHKSRLIQT